MIRIDKVYIVTTNLSNQHKLVNRMQRMGDKEVFRFGLQLFFEIVSGRSLMSPAPPEKEVVLKYLT